MRSAALGVLVLIASAALAADTTFESSESCGTCHKTIYDSWRESAHARAMEDPVFLHAYRETEMRGGKEQSRTCLGCHAPLVDVNADVALQLRITWEGVNCEVCHRLVSVDLSGSGPRQTLDKGPAKRGPVSDAPEDAHPVAYSELHLSSLACAWCHEYVNPAGTPIMTTYSEWKSSSAAADGRTCQSCHMGRTDVQVEDPRVARSPNAEINLHHVPGGHSLEQLHQALGLDLDSVRADDQLALTVKLRNKGAGHAVPTGMPGRRVRMEVVVRGSGDRMTEERTYGTVFVDGDGKPVTHTGDYFTRAVRATSDTRIQPDETRSETFTFAVPDDQIAYVTVKLHYEHAASVTDEGRTRFTFLSESRTLVPARKP